MLAKSLRCHRIDIVTATRCSNGTRHAKCHGRYGTNQRTSADGALRHTAGATIVDDLGNSRKEYVPDRVLGENVERLDVFLADFVKLTTRDVCFNCSWKFHMVEL